MAAILEIIKSSHICIYFSPREKEQPLAAFVKFVCLEAEFRLHFAKTLGAFLPLPAGAGRGEGNAAANGTDTGLFNPL